MERFITHTDNSTPKKIIKVKALLFGRFITSTYENLDCFYNEKIGEWYFFEWCKNGFTLNEFISVERE